MYVVSLISPQEDCGKTTLAAHIALQAQQAGTKSVALVDADDDGDLSRWATRRRGRDPICIAAGGSELADRLRDLGRSGIELAIVDTASDVSSDFELAVAASDLVLVPIAATGLDALAIIMSVRCAQRQGKPFLFIVNRRTADDEDFMESAMGLAQHGTISPIVLPACPELSELMDQGETTIERPNGSAFPIAELWTYLESRLRRPAAPTRTPLAPPVASVQAAGSDADNRRSILTLKKNKAYLDLSAPATVPANGTALAGGQSNGRLSEPSRPPAAAASPEPSEPAPPPEKRRLTREDIANLMLDPFL